MDIMNRRAESLRKLQDYRNEIVEASRKMEDCRIEIAKLEAERKVEMVKFDRINIEMADTLG